MSYIPSINDFIGHVIVKETACQKADNIDVTVVTVCFNPLKDGRRDVFQKNLDSVQSQTGVCLEHLIIDGNSSDGTLDWLMSYNNTNHEIRILSKPDSGIYDAMNRAIALARGKYIIYLNSDDFFHNPRGMSLSVARLEELKCDFSFAPIRFDRSLGFHHPQLHPQSRLYRFLISWSFSHQSMLTSRSMLIRVGGFDTSYRSAADFDLLLRMIVAGAKGCFVPHSFSTFSTGGFSADNGVQIATECTRSLRNFYKNLYSVDMQYQEVAYIIKNRIYPKKYLHIYKQSQKLIRERFIGVPKGPVAGLLRWFNYTKYYLKCRNSKR